jgi:hypothetical protein
LPWSTWAMMAILRIVWLTGAQVPFLLWQIFNLRRDAAANGPQIMMKMR